MSILYSGDPMRHAFPGVPGGWTSAMQRRAKVDLELIAGRFDGFAQHIAEPDSDADVEEFWEPTARTAAAIRVATARNAPFEHRDAHHPDGWTPEQLSQRLGPVANTEEQRHRVDPLLLPELTRQHGGRWMSLAGYNDEESDLEPEHDLVELILGRARLGVECVVIKMGESKSGLFTLDLWPNMTADDVKSLIFKSDDGWTFVLMAGKRGAFLVQDWIPMEHEYRLFVVDWVLVSGAGCVEEFTPYNRIDPSVNFDTRTRANRGNDVVGGNPTPVGDNPDLVRRYITFGQQLAKQCGGTVTVDVALLCNDIVVVELNTLPNSGLYASNTDAVYRALAQATDRGYGAYNFPSDIASRDVNTANGAPGR